MTKQMVESVADFQDRARGLDKDQLRAEVAENLQKCVDKFYRVLLEDRNYSPEIQEKTLAFRSELHEMGLAVETRIPVEPEDQRSFVNPFPQLGKFKDMLGFDPAIVELLRDIEILITMAASNRFLRFTALKGAAKTKGISSPGAGFSTGVGRKGSGIGAY